MGESDGVMQIRKERKSLCITSHNISPEKKVSDDLVVVESSDGERERWFDEMLLLILHEGREH